jgi:prepilin-type N-terminal cleavage/methylation domain-containing protein/prepilin-type processing-associated H-X9-DG protein
MIWGFTLIELLVVIAIMSMLIGLLVPALQLAMDYIHKLQCDNNLEQIWVGLQLYTGDNSGRCPDPNVTDPEQIALKFMEELQPYVKSEDIFWCPDDPEKSTHPGGSYYWRVTRDSKTSIAGVRLDLLRHPERVIIAGELSHGFHKSELINVLYADGHVGLVNKEEFLRNITKPLEFS